MFGRRRIPSARPYLLMFRIDRPIARISSSLVLYQVPGSASFTLTKISQSHWLGRKRRHLVMHNPIILHDNAKCHTTAVMDLWCRWKWEILEHPLYSPNMSPCDYNLFAKVEEPLREIGYNIRDEFIRAIGRSIRNINKDGHADGLWRLPNIWKKVINKRVIEGR